MSARTPVRRGLVLGGGGVLGAAWMIGALSAVADAYDWDPREAQILVGTSAGSVLSALLGCGIGVDTLLNHQRGVQGPGDPEIDFDHDTASGGALPPLPRFGIGSASLLGRAVRHPGRVPILAALAGLAPRGRGTLTPVGDLVHTVSPGDGWAPHPATWIVGMDYDTGRRIAFGAPGAPQAPLAEAVMASCAIPGWYTPIPIGGRRYVDGGTCSPTSLDLLAGQGLDEVVVLAPMISFDYDEPPSVLGRMERRPARSVGRAPR
jgi:NTE family protein